MGREWGRSFIDPSFLLLRLTASRDRKRDDLRLTFVFLSSLIEPTLETSDGKKERKEIHPFLFLHVSRDREILVGRGKREGVGIRGVSENRPGVRRH